MSEWKKIKFLQVADPGTGMDPEDHPVVIDPLGRAWRTGHVNRRRLRQRVPTLDEAKRLPDGQ